jgi:hypothetical protein
MTSRRLLILGLAAIVAIVAGVWLAGRQGSSGTSAATGALYPGLKEQLNAVNAVRLYKAGDARVVELVRKDDAWKVSDRDNYPADESKVRKLLIALADAKIAEQKTSDAQQYATLGVEDTKGSGATSVRIELADPSVGEREGAAGCFPSELVAQPDRQLEVDVLLHRLLQCAARRRQCRPLPLSRHRGKELGREEVAVGVVKQHVIQNAKCKMQKGPYPFCILNFAFCITQNVIRNPICPTLCSGCPTSPA